ncbi:MAG: sigma-70 family RNA polymerase sigma factor [Planctomycetes bacterium]|nr:sigma-70 family RNA polymerase sigma factor [Planctomycetota bacterium]
MCEFSDEALILGCRGAGEERARALVGELAQRHLDRVVGFLYGLTGDAAVAHDLAQEAFVRVYRHRERYREVARFSTWLYTIARNLALNELRNRQRRPQVYGASTTSDPALHPLDAAPASGASPVEAAAEQDLQHAVRAAVRSLQSPYREVVVLCDLEERSYAEAAEILGVPIGTVRSRLSRARGRLEQRLRPLLERGGSA